jgi:acyl-CoA synthetase (AMP-forming)/AMP-acid ligase II
VVVDTLPRNAAGKILKQALRDEHARSTGAAADGPR